MDVLEVSVNSGMLEAWVDDSLRRPDGWRKMDLLEAERDLGINNIIRVARGRPFLPC